ncbi:MAG: ATP-dependent helicase [Kiritimatiellae bacterium]|nr:ATP-dependent helicase [Kiritimatiellia bacterium]
MTDFAKLLNPEQCEAATAGDGPLLVLAAAGTGKTRTLVHRVAFLLEQGAAPESILLLTFTNRAAKEMVERARVVVGEDADLIWSGTFHSICARLLRTWAGFFGFKSSFKILDDDDQKKILSEIIKARIANPKDFPKKEIVAKMISEAANEMVDVERVAKRWLTKAAGFTPAEILQVAQAYAERKRELSAMDFDDLIVYGLRLLKECAHAREILQERFRYILVDEYQDTNIVQAEFTDILAAKHRNIMAVGDDFQCIYTWRGAQIDNIMRFPQRWPGCRIVKLERNYRSMPDILNIANTVMKDVPGQFQKNLRPTRQGDNNKPKIYRVYNSKAQAKEILNLVTRLKAIGYANRDIAILYRSHFHSVEIEKTLHTSGFAYRLTSGTGFFEKEHVKDVLAYLRLIADDRDEMSFMRFITLLPGVGDAGAKKMWQKLSCRFNMFDPAQRGALGDMLGAKARPLWPGIADAMSKVATHMENGQQGMPAADFIKAFYENYLKREWESEEAEERLSDVKELASDLAGEERELDEYLADAALMTNLDLRKNDPTQDRITLSTVHQAKGMEWPVVIVPWLCEGMFPSAKASEEGRDEEERRLFYVVVTRAKDMLFMYAPRMRRAPEGGEFPVGASVFLKNIPRNLVDVESIESYEQNAYRSYGGGYGGGYGGSYGRGYGTGGRDRYGYGGGSYGKSWRR